MKTLHEGRRVPEEEDISLELNLPRYLLLAKCNFFSIHNALQQCFVHIATLTLCVPDKFIISLKFLNKKFVRI